MNYICERCKGTGLISETYCDYCVGDGEVDWVDNIFKPDNELRIQEILYKIKLVENEFYDSANIQNRKQIQDKLNDYFKNDKIRPVFSRFLHRRIWVTFERNLDYGSY